MKAFVFIAEDGMTIARAGCDHVLPEAAFEIPRSMLGAGLDKMFLHHQSGELRPRPTLPVPTMDGLIVKVIGAPDGCLLEIEDCEACSTSTHAVDQDGAASVTLPEDGTFRATLRGPPPWLPGVATFVLGTSESSAAAMRLSQARTQSVERINQMAGDLRKRLVTNIPGQDALYLEKRAEAQAYIAATGAAGGTEPETLDLFPLLAGEVGVTAATPWQLAQLWLNRSDLFLRVGAATEQARMRAIAAIATAPDFTTLEAIESDFTQGLSGLSL